MKEKKTGEDGQALQKYDAGLLRAAKFAYATLEFAALATAGVLKSGGAGVRQFIGSAQRKIAHQKSTKAPLKDVSEKKTEVVSRLGLEERLALLEKRLLALEKDRSGAQLGKGKVAVEVERHNLLVELAKITKSYINAPARK